MNSAAFPGCGGGAQTCPFGGAVQLKAPFSQQYVYASSEAPHQDHVHYLVWNDQMFKNPLPTRVAPWAHSKGTLVKDSTGDCTSSQNGRGGMFFATTNTQLQGSMARLLTGTTAPVE